MTMYNKANFSAVKCAAGDGSRPAIGGVLFHKDKTVATDSCKLVEVSTPRDVDINDFPPDHKIMRGCRPFIADAAGLKRIKVKPNKKLPILSNAALAHVDDNKIEFHVPAGGDDLAIDRKQVLRVQGDYPDYEKIIPKTKPVTKMRVNIEYLKQVLDVIKETNCTVVDIETRGDKEPMVILGTNQQQPSRGLLMPIMPK